MENFLIRSVLRNASGLETTEHDLDAVVAFVAALVLFDGVVAYLSARDAGHGPLFLQGIAELVGVITPVGQHPLGLGHCRVKRLRHCDR